MTKPSYFYEVVNLTRKLTVTVGDVRWRRAPPGLATEPGEGDWVRRTAANQRPRRERRHWRTAGVVSRRPESSGKETKIGHLFDGDEPRRPIVLSEDAKFAAQVRAEDCAADAGIGRRRPAAQRPIAVGLQRDAVAARGRCLPRSVATPRNGVVPVADQWPAQFCAGRHIPAPRRRRFSRSQFVQAQTTRLADRSQSQTDAQTNQMKRFTWFYLKRRTFLKLFFNHETKLIWMRYCPLRNRLIALSRVIHFKNLRINKTTLCRIQWKANELKAQTVSLSSIFISVFST